MNTTLVCNKNKILVYKKYPAGKVKEIVDNEFVDVDKEEHIKYLYISEEEVPVAKGEDINKRLPHVQFFSRGGKDWTAKFQSRPTFYKDGDKWYDTKFSEITVEGFKEETGEDV